MWSEHQTEKRDLPLGFRHRLSDRMTRQLGLPRPKNKHRADARASILAEVLLAHHEGRAVSFSRRPQYYSDRYRYFGPSGTFANTTGEVSLLASAGLLIENRARPGSRGRQST